MEEPDFWDNPEKSNGYMKELKGLKADIEDFKKLEKDKADAEEFIEMAYEENDESLIPEIGQLVDNFEKLFEKLQLETLLSGEYDKCNAILTLHAGAGGTESCDWASMLLRMYTRWANSKGFTVETLDMLEGDEAGVKSVTIQVNGLNASQTGAYITVQCSGKETDFVRVMRCNAGYRGRFGCGYQRG